MPLLSADDIRAYTKDNSELNILLEGELQSGDELIDLAMRLSVEDFNAQAPVTNYNTDNFPNTTILLYGVLHHLTNSEAERQLRNQVNYNAQGLQAGIDDKHQVYNQLAQYYKQMFEQKMQEFKRFLNQEEAWGNIPSPYSTLNQYKYRS